MRKTSVYLTDEDARDLRRVATLSGRPQAELIREGIRSVLAERVGRGRRRKFRSLGKGRGGGAPYAPWEADDLHRSVTGRK
jgi:hypothetical protein